MMHAENQDDDVQILEADFSLLNKIGKGNLDRLLSADAVSKAQKIIANAADDFYRECLTDSVTLRKLIGSMRPGIASNDPLVKSVIASAFAIKTKSGQAGFDLVAQIAKSLHILCEEAASETLGSPTVKIIDWHGTSLNHLLAAKIKGDGGKAGKAILVEVEKIKRTR